MASEAKTTNQSAHEKYIRQFMFLLNDDLPAKKKEDLETHLANCQACTRALLLFRAGLGKGS